MFYHGGLRGRRITLWCEVRDGKLCLSNGDELPALVESSRVELVVNPHAIADEEFRDELTERRNAVLLPAGSQVFCTMRPRSGGDFQGLLVRPDDWDAPGDDWYFGRVELLTDLRL